MYDGNINLQMFIKKIFLWFAAAWQAVKQILDTILANHWYLISVTIITFFIFILGFFSIYIFIHFFQIQNITPHNGKLIVGAKNYINAFKMSESMVELRTLEAQNDLF